jgi:ectoine hydroxylase-related dioxygenase (phytanoyl-CoA dioxygenase family)
MNCCSSTISGASAARRSPKSLLAPARNPVILEICKRSISGDQILSQQNGVINPPAKTYNQGAWHRDLPYQHVVFSRPMAINALFCLDPFTAENGATMVLPATHKQEEFPSDRFVDGSTVQVCAPAGSDIVLDCMLCHSGAEPRRRQPGLHLPDHPSANRPAAI